jgi:1-acyl-sn-glycerol-3-phosphate acyltransferase
VSVGKPIPSSGKDAQTLMAEVEEWIEAEVARLGRPEAVPA